MLNEIPLAERVEKTWGNFELYAHDEACTVKIITVAPGGPLSRQYHNERDEPWIVLDPGARRARGADPLS